MAGFTPPPIQDSVPRDAVMAHVQSHEESQQDTAEISHTSHLTRRQIHYAGNVQGVGFRFTVLQIAADLDVRGYVRNLHDGRVLLVVEGRHETAETLIRAIAERMEGYVAETMDLTLPPTNEFSQFEIRR